MVFQIAVYFKMLYKDLFPSRVWVRVCVFACVWHTCVWVHMNLYACAYGGPKLLPDAFLAHPSPYPYSRRQSLSAEPRA